MLNTAVFGAGPSPVVVAVAIVLAVALLVGLVLALFVWRRNRRAGADLDFQPESLIDGLVSTEDAFVSPAPEAPAPTEPPAVMAPVTRPLQQDTPVEPTPEPVRPVLDEKMEEPIEPAEGLVADDDEPESEPTDDTAAGAVEEPGPEEADPETDDEDEDDEEDEVDSARVFFTAPLTDAGKDPEAKHDAESHAKPDEDVVEPAPVQDLVAHTVIGRMTAIGDRRAQFSVLTGIDAERDHALLVQTARIAGDGSIGWTAVRVSPGALEPDLVKLVERTLEETGRAPGDLMLDLPAGQPPTRAMVKTLDGLSEMGIPLGLHGFGSRVDQLLEYGELPLSYVSIDHLALRRFGERGHDIAAQLHRLGHDLGFDAIAVGASTDEDSAERGRIYRFALGAPSAGAEATGTDEEDPAPEPVAEQPTAEPEPPRRRSALHPDFEA